MSRTLSWKMELACIDPDHKPTTPIAGAYLLIHHELTGFRKQIAFEKKIESTNSKE